MRSLLAGIALAWIAASANAGWQYTDWGVTLPGLNHGASHSRASQHRAV